MNNQFGFILFAVGVVVLGASCSHREGEAAVIEDSPGAESGGVVGVMSSSSRPKGVSQMAEIAVGAVLLRLEGVSLSDEALFEEPASHGTLRFPSRRLHFERATQLGPNQASFSGVLVIPDLSRQVYIRADGVTFETQPGEKSVLPEIEALVASGGDLVVLARKDHQSPVSFVRNVFKASADGLTVDGVSVSVSSLFAWVEDLKLQMASRSDAAKPQPRSARPRPPMSPVVNGDRNVIPGVR